MKKLLLLLVFLVTCSISWAQSCSSPFTPDRRFAFYDVATKTQITSSFLCVGQQIRVKDASTPRTQGAIYYQWSTTGYPCTSFKDTTSFFTPQTAGDLYLTINIQNSVPGNSGALVSPNPFLVRPASEPEFSLQGCGPDLVTVTVTDKVYDTYLVQVGTGASLPILRNTPLSLPVSGTTAITVTGQYAGATPCRGVRTRSFTPQPQPRQPIIQRLTVQNDGGLEFQFGALQPEYRYAIQVNEGAGDYRTVANVATPVAGYIVPNLPKVGCYRLLLSDACQTSIALSSADICSISLTAASSNGRNRLTWTTSQGGSFEVSRNGTLLTRLPAGTTQYEDTAAACGVAYTYRVAAVSGAISSVSNEAPVSTTAGPASAAPRLEQVSFNLRNQVEVTTELLRGPGGGQYTYFRNGTELLTSANRTTLDSLATIRFAEPLCYTVRLLDACGNRSASSAPLCPVLLEARAAGRDSTQIRLRWTPLGGLSPTALVRYTVITLSATNNELSRVPVNGLTYLDLQPPQDQQVLRYRIEAAGSGLQRPSYSNIATVVRPLKLFVPTAFTPNGDGLNDVLELKGRYLNNFRFVVIDRNGQEVFRASNRTQTWDGRIGSTAPVPGAYVWRFEAIDQDGQRVTQHGTVTIVR
jgi:gliding motility-associated-like protein